MNKKLCPTKLELKIFTGPKDAWYIVYMDISTYFYSIYIYIPGTSNISNGRSIIKKQMEVGFRNIHVERCFFVFGLTIVCYYWPT